MDKEYKELLIRSIKATEITANAVDALKDASKTINDNLVSHNQTMANIYKLACEGNKISEANNKILLRYLRWAVIALVVALGGAKILAEAKDIIASYAL